MTEAGRYDDTARRYRASDVDPLRGHPGSLKRRLLMSENIAGIRIPDSKLAREATDLLREHGTPLLFAHSLRVFLFGSLRGRHRGLQVDHELLYVGAVFHDFGLTPNYRSPDHWFEVDGANSARDFLRANGIDEEA